MRILSKTEVKKVLRQLNKQFEIKDLKLDYIFLKSEKDRIFIVNKDFGEVDVENINTVGLYIAKVEKDGIRLSIEGSQIFGAKASKNVLVLDKPDEWLLGNNIGVKVGLKGYVIVKCGEDFLGCGKIVKDKLYNFVPKSRRISEVAPS